MPTSLCAATPQLMTSLMWWREIGKLLKCQNGPSLVIPSGCGLLKSSIPFQFPLYRCRYVWKCHWHVTAGFQPCIFRPLTFFSYMCIWYVFMNNSHSQCLVTTESTSPAFMCSTKSTRSPLRNSTSSTRFPTVSPSQLTTAGTSMTCWKRCGTIYSLCACKSCLYSHHRGAKNSWLFKWCRKRSEIHMLFQTAEFDWFHVLIFSYTKPKGQLPDYTSPVVLPDGRTSVEDFCLKIHKNLIKELK